MYYNPGNVLRLNGSMPDLWTGDGDIYIYVYIHFFFLKVY